MHQYTLQLLYFPEYFVGTHLQSWPKLSDLFLQQ